jgi:hypothetical protein
MPNTQEAEIMKIVVQNQTWEKSWQEAISTNKAGCSVGACHQSYSGAIR